MLYTFSATLWTKLQFNMWQSRLEIEHYSVACIFRPRYRVQSGVAQNFCSGRGSYTVRRLIRYSCTFATCMSPALNESFAPQCFKHGNAVELRNRIMFDFHPGLPHMLYRKCLLELLLLSTVMFTAAVLLEARMVAWQLYCPPWDVCRVVNSRVVV